MMITELQIKIHAAEQEGPSPDIQMSHFAVLSQAEGRKQEKVFLALHVLCDIIIITDSRNYIELVSQSAAFPEGMF